MASKLSQIQARFQQKQMQEKEEKLLRLYESQQQRAIERVNRGSAERTTSAKSSTSIQKGKVRQMFDERRQKAGIDRSYPLEPLKPSKTTTYNNYDKQNDNSFNTSTKTTIKKSLTHIKNGKPLIDKNEFIESVYNNNNGDESYEERIYEGDVNSGPIFNRTYRRRDLEMMMNDFHVNDNIDDEEFPEVDISEFEEPVVKPRLANIGGKLPSQNGVSPKRNVEQKIFIKNNSPLENSVNESKRMNPTKPATKKPVTRIVNSPSTRSAPTNLDNKLTPPRSSPNRIINKRSAEMIQSTSSKSQGYQKKSGERRTSSSKQTAPGLSAVNRDDLDTCKYCERRFASDRLRIHEEICARTTKKKRKVYDATKHRVQGTELEPFAKKTNRTASQKPANKSGPLLKQQNTKQSGKAVPSKKTDWRRKHEEFIGAIRAAKMAQAHVAKGGKLTDLPPPPPSSNPDYVQCPHCGRRFNESAAERHIPKCANYDYNKPKQQPRLGGGKTSLNKTR